MNAAGRYRIKYIMKLSLAYLFYYGGFFLLYKAFKLRNRAVVLMYHRVLPSEIKARSFSHDGIIVDPTTFEKHIQFLGKHFALLSLQDFIRAVEQRTPFKNSSCLITFDDGWQDNYRFAYPILRRHAAPALIFLTANYVASTDQFWQERLSALLFALYRLAREQQELAEKYDAVLEKHQIAGILRSSGEDLRSSIQEAVSTCKRKTYEDIGKMISELSAVAEDVQIFRETVDTFLTWEEIIEMASSGIAFGSHTMNHKILTKILPEEAEKEIAESRKCIEGRLKDEVAAFSYPNGDYSRDLEERVKSHGYAVAFVTKPGYVNAHDDPFAIKRINIHNDMTKNAPMFLATILGIF